MIRKVGNDMTIAIAILGGFACFFYFLYTIFSINGFTKNLENYRSIGIPLSVLAFLVFTSFLVLSLLTPFGILWIVLIAILGALSIIGYVWMVINAGIGYDNSEILFVIGIPFTLIIIAHYVLALCKY